jgi:CRISPR/Cas system-associated exonuclease Cas4 (RecB family)
VVPFNEALREETRNTTEAVHALLRPGPTPPPPPLEIVTTLCPACSLRDVCMPLAPRKSAAAYLQSVLEGA